MRTWWIREHTGIWCGVRGNGCRDKGGTQGRGRTKAGNVVDAGEEVVCWKVTTLNTVIIRYYGYEASRVENSASIEIT